MKDVLDLNNILRDKAEKYAEDVAAEIGIASHQLPADVFNIIFNQLTLCLETLNFYYVAFSNQTSAHGSIDDALRQNGERIVLITKIFFLQAMSTVEKSFKDYVNIFPEKIGTCKSSSGRVYLYNIMDQSNANAVFSHNDFNLWKGLIFFRNSIVHNNAISEETAEYEYPGYKLTLIKDEMVQGNIVSFLYLIDWLLDASKDWILEMHKLGPNAPKS